jgi:hypothetical protein
MLALEDRVVTGIWVLLDDSRNRRVNFVQANPLIFFPGTWDDTLLII